jgi:hypothetical protein
VLEALLQVKPPSKSRRMLNICAAAV